MAVYLNPQYYQGPRMSLVKLAAKNSQTWQVMQPLKMTDSGIVKCLSNDSTIHGFAAETVGTATSSSNVWVHKLESSETKFIVGVTSGGTDCAAALALIGTNKGLAVNSCVATLSLGNDSKKVFRIHDVMGRVEPQGNSVDDVPGFAIVSVLQSAIDNTATGV